MDKKQFYISRINDLDALLDNEKMFLSTLSSCTARGSIACHNWEKDFPHRFPILNCGWEVMFRMAFSEGYLYVYWHLVSDGLRALHTTDLSPVAQDNCMELFLQVPGQDEYWNFEVNALGTLNASHRVTRPQPVRLTPQELASIKRMGSHVGHAPFNDTTAEPYNWWVALAIPWKVMGLDAHLLPPHLMGNLYACAGAIEKPYYISCFPIDTERPDFHRPDFFGKIILSQ